MTYIVTILIFISLFLGGYSLLYTIYKDKLVLNERMESIRDIDKINIHGNSEKQSSFSSRAFIPIQKSLIGIVRKISRGEQVNKLNKKLDKAGLSNKYTYEKWVYNMIIITTSVSATFGGITYLISPDIISVVKSIFFGMFFTFVLTRYYLGSKISKKQKSIVKDLPFTLDLITVSVEAGLSFDGAIARVINNIEGNLSDEFAKTLKEMKMGIERKAALRNMSDRNDIKELSMLITSLIQADSLGVSLGNVLRIESDQLRETRKQTAREKAMKAPVKILFPLIIFIFPAIFVIILGPAIIEMSERFF